MLSEPNYNSIFSENVTRLMKEQGLDHLVLGVLLNLKPSSVSDLITGRSDWRLKHIAKIARFFNVTTDVMIFGDEDFIKKEAIKNEIDLRLYVRDKLIKEKKYKQLGQLEAKGYFNIIKEIESAIELKTKNLN